MIDIILKILITLLVIFFYGFCIYNFGSTIAIFVICTAGIGAIPIIMVVSSTILFLRKLWGNPRAKNSSPNLSIHQKKLIIYINSCENNGINKEDIVKKLIEGGWDPKTIEEAYTIRNKFKCFDNRYIF